MCEADGRKQWEKGGNESTRWADEIGNRGGEGKSGTS